MCQDFFESSIFDKWLPFQLIYLFYSYFRYMSTLVYFQKNLFRVFLRRYFFVKRHIFWIILAD